VRIALMTDVASVDLSCASGLRLRRAGEFGDGQRISTSSLRVEARPRFSAPAPVEMKASPYRVSVGSSLDARGARKLADELKQRFFEPVEVTFDATHQEYLVLIGVFKVRSDAARMIELLRKSGYADTRIVNHPNNADSPSIESVIDTNGRDAKHRAQADQGFKSSGRSMQLVAMAGDKVTASSDELVVSPAVETTRQITFFGDEDRARQQHVRNGIVSAAQAVRVGTRHYRGEMHIILNARGRLNVVNALPLEEYLRGVVPMEVSPVSHPELEVMKALAIAARSYALVHLGQHRSEGYDIVDDARAQAYGGITAERELSNRAVEETRGIAAVFRDPDGRLIPIEAMFTADCGGRTENNEDVFGGKPLPYLRSVVCSSEPQSFVGKAITTGRTREPLIGTDGRSLAREVALLSVLGFALPRRVTSSYLRSAPDREELESWIEEVARLSQKTAHKERESLGPRRNPKSSDGDVLRLSEFVRLVVQSIYSEGASTMQAQHLNYLLDGVRIEALSPQARQDTAMLLRDGILRLPADGLLDGRAAITRGQTIETLARAISKHETAELKYLQYGISLPATGRRLSIAMPRTDRSAAPRVTSAKVSAAGQVASSPKVASRPLNIAATDDEKSKRVDQEYGFDIAEDAWLFRNLAGESYNVDRLMLIGGERVTYHLNTAGQVDFLEASSSERNASADRFSAAAQWNQRVTVEEMQQKLARVRINVGRPNSIKPVAFSPSSRVTEVEITGDRGRAALRRPQLRGVLGLKESLFVVDRETDSRGRVVAFVFTGRGWGHGVGMCQVGAYALAREGYTHAAILQKYYTGVSLKELY